MCIGFLFRWMMVTAALGVAGCRSTTVPKVRVAEAGGGRVWEKAMSCRACGEALGAAGTAWEDMGSPQPAYNEAVERFLRHLQQRLPPREWNGPLRLTDRGRVWEVTFDAQPESWQGHPEWSPEGYDRILPAGGFKLEGYDRIVAGEGTGSPVVLAYDDITRLRRERPYRPGAGLYVPGTAVLEFSKPRADGVVPVRLRIYNTWEKREAMMAGRKRALGYNLTAAVEAGLGNPYIRKDDLAGLLRPGKFTQDHGVFSPGAAYDPRKIPVLFVHGLKSDASIWRNAVNEIAAEPGLAARYQPILYLYPTGTDVGTAAAELRTSLRQYRDKWDPDHDDPRMNRMVMVGHSMGGLLTRFQVIDSGEDMERAYFSRPLHELRGLTPEERRALQERLVFAAQPFVKRAVFIACPHQGSDLAETRVVGILTRLIRLPQEVTKLVADVVTLDLDEVNPDLLGFRNLGMRSVDMLSPHHPYFAALARRPIKVPQHSIIGDRGRGNTPNSSDGFVPYWSSHLRGAVSELIVPYDHHCAGRTETVREIMRILRLHAGM